jgi:hypothetical protein
MNEDEDKDICPNCRMQMQDSEVCSFCHYRRHEKSNLDKALTSLPENKRSEYEEVIELWETYGGS